MLSYFRYAMILKNNNEAVLNLWLWLIAVQEMVGSRIHHECCRKSWAFQSFPVLQTAKEPSHQSKLTNKNTKTYRIWYCTSKIWRNHGIECEKSPPAPLLWSNLWNLQYLQINQIILPGRTSKCGLQTCSCFVPCLGPRPAREGG